HDVIPILKDLNPNLEKTIQRSMMKNSGISELAKLGREVLESKFVRDTDKTVIVDKAVVASFRNQPAVLFKIIKLWGFSLDHADQICTSLNAQPGKQFNSPTYQLTIDRNEMIISPLTSLTSEIIIERDQIEVIRGDQKLHVGLGTELTLPPDQDQAVLDAD